MSESHWINAPREEYASGTLSESDVLPNPLDLFALWYQQAAAASVPAPDEMTLATVSAEGKPATRIVLLKAITPEGLAFVTNYDSRKGDHISANPHVAINFWWKKQERQIRIEGIASPTSRDLSAEYFSKRPREAQIGAWASPQSRTIPNRDALDYHVTQYAKKFENEKHIPLPPHWGGYLVKPTRFEFWQGRPSRLHDRIEYLPTSDGKWTTHRLAP